MVFKKYEFIFFFFMWSLKNFNFFFFKNFISYNLKFFLINKLDMSYKNNLLITDYKKSYIFFKNSVLQKKSFFFYILFSPTNKKHWIYANYELFSPKNNLISNDLFFIRNFNCVLNLTYNLLINNLNFFFIPSNFFNNELASFHKYIYGVKNYWFLDYTNFFSIKDLRKHSFKYHVYNFIDTKKIKLFIFLADTPNSFYFQFFKKQNITTFGLVSLTSTPIFFDYWVVTRVNDFIIQYFMISSFYSIYNLVLHTKQNSFFKNYKFLFLKSL